MQPVTRVHEGPYQELDDLLETAGFSLETVRMALSIGRRAKSGLLSLEDRLRSDDVEERESAMVAMEALDHARAAYLDLAHLLDQEELADTGLAIRFWSTFEWCWTRLYSDPVRMTGQKALRHELAEARARTADLQRRLRDSRHAPPTLPPIH